jgi:hypothetical protein
MTAEEPIQVPVVFDGAEDVPIQFANQFVVLHQDEEFILVVGQFSQPILLGSAEERQAQARQLSYLPVKVVARLGLTRHRLVELIQALQENLATYDRAREQR